MEMELTGNYPIIFDGKERGRLDVSRDGLFWCFEATSEMSDGIIRLSVFGDDGEGYLGIMEPSGERMRLKKKLSRSTLKDFPQRITHCGKQGQVQTIADAGINLESPQQSEVLAVAAVGAPEQESSCPECEADIPESRQHNQRPPPEDAEPLNIPLVWKMCGCPAAYLSTIEGKNIFGGLSNVLEATDGEFVYLALPENSSHIHPEQQKFFLGKAVIMGDSYLICKTKNGNIL